MRNQQFSAFTLIVGASLLGSITAASFSGCKPPSARSRTAEATATSSKAENDSAPANVSTPAISNQTVSNTTASSNVTAASETPLAGETPVPSEEAPAVAAQPDAKVAMTPKPADAKPVEAKPADAKPAEASPVKEYVSTDEVMNAGKDWPQWGGTRLRNNAPNVTGLPESWDIGKFDRRSGEWDKTNAENIVWFTPLGSQTYGNPVVAGGRVFVGTNNGAGHLKRYPASVDLGCLLAINEENGELLWQHSSEKLITGRVHDWPLQGICCAPLVEGERLWFVTSRGEVRCLDAAGYYDGEDDGPVKAEVARVADLMIKPPAESDDEEWTPGPGNIAIDSLGEGKVADPLINALADAGEEIKGDVKIEAVTEGKVWKATGNFGGVDRDFTIRIAGPRLSVFKNLGVDDKRDADTIWIYNMMTELNVSQHNMCSCSVTSYGDLLFVNTSNGQDESHANLPSPDAPTFICLNKNTGKLLWSDNSPGTNVLHGQWSSPTVAVLGGVPQVIFAGGDGWVYSFRADEGADGKGYLLWKFDANPKETEWKLGGEGTRNNIIATPTVYNDLVYVAVGQDPEHGEGEGHLWCIDPTKRGDVSPQLAMKVEGDQRVPIAHKRIQAVEAEKGEIAVDNPNSAAIWHYSMQDQNDDDEIDFEEEMHRTIGSIAIKDDVLYIADFSGIVHCLDARGKDGQPVVHFTYDMLAQSWGSPLIADGRVFVGDEDGDVTIFEFGGNNPDPVDEINMGSSVYSTPVAANGRIYISTKDKLFAIEDKK